MNTSTLITSCSTGENAHVVFYMNKTPTSFSLCLRKARATCCKEASISATTLPPPSHSSLWHLCQSHLSDSCSLSQHATCHLEIRDNYTAHNNSSLRIFPQPSKRHFCLICISLDRLLISHHLLNGVFTLIKGATNIRNKCEAELLLTSAPPQRHRPRWWGLSPIAWLFTIYLALTKPEEHRRLSPNHTVHRLHFTPFVKQATLSAFGYEDCSLLRRESLQTVWHISPWV